MAISRDVAAAAKKFYEQDLLKVTLMMRTKNGFSSQDDRKLQNSLTEYFMLPFMNTESNIDSALTKIEIKEKLVMLLTCLVFLYQNYLEKSAPVVVNSLFSVNLNSFGVW